LGPGPRVAARRVAGPGPAFQPTERRVPRRRTLHVLTALLLLSIAVDLTLVHTCALDVVQASDARHLTLTAVGGAGGGGHHDAPLHPDHCCCHGLSTGASRALLAAPRRQAETVLESPPGHPLHASAALYHPPQLPA